MSDIPDDLCYLERFDNDTILKCLEQRYNNNQIHTYIGDVLVAFNPCKPLPIYDIQHHAKYSSIDYKSQQPPHIFWTADLAYRSLTDYRVSRCIIVSGISGAGKTESTKHILKHVLRLGDSRKCIPHLMSKLENVNPLLEIFGNAKTSLNDNSSRFGKLTLLQYDIGNSLVGAMTHHFTLEKSRIVRQQTNEKNFHIFYALLAGLSQQELSKYGLRGHAGQFRILNDISQDDAINKCKESTEYQEMFSQALENFRAIGFTNEDVDNIFKILAAILLLTNIEFTEDEFGNPVIEDDNESKFLSPVCDLLGIDEPEGLILALIADEKPGVEDPIPKHILKAEEGRDALAKYLYCCMFDGILKNINELLSHRDRHGSRRIGILDISGFENLQSSKDASGLGLGGSSQKNSYEQFFINITNEKLHQFFLKHVFMHEQEEYEREGIRFEDIKYTDNAEVLDLLISASVNSKSIVSLLEDCNQHPGSTDESFVCELNKQFGQRIHYKRHIKPQQFEVIHFAGNVVYSAKDFLAKNTDTLSASLRICIMDSDNPFLNRATRCNSLSRTAMHNINKRRLQENRLQGCASRDYLKSQLNLGRMLDNMTPLFVRCIKPNTTLQPCMVERDYVRQQLQSSGVFEVAAVRSIGYSIRLTRHEFIQRFTELIEHMDLATDEEKIKCIFQKVDIHYSHYQVGHTKVFMKENYFCQLNNKLEEKKQVMRCKKEVEIERQRDITEKQLKLKKQVLDPHITIENEVDNILLTASTVTSSFQELSRHSLSNKKKAVSLEDEYVVVRDEDKLAFDMFRDRPTHEAATYSFDQFEKIFMRVSRVLMYIVLFSMVLVSGVLVKIWILSLVSKFEQNSQEDRGPHADRLMVCLTVPWGITFLLSLIKVLFGKTNNLQWKHIVPVVLIDALQVIGVMLMLFIVLPTLDVFRGAVIMMCVGIIPAVFVFLNNIRAFKLNRLRFINNVVAIFSLGIQVGSFLTLCLDSTNDFPTWAFILSCTLISLGWWENFSDGQIQLCKAFLIDFTKIKSLLGQSRHKLNVYGMIMKICVTVLFIQFYVKSDTYRNKSQNSLNVQPSTLDNTAVLKESLINSIYRLYRDNAITLHVIVFTLLCTYASTLACKLKMQLFAFSLPIVMVAPVTLVVVYLKCKNIISMNGFIWSGVQCQTYEISNLNYTITVAAMLWFSSITITWYIWIPRNDRMAKIESMFVEPLKESTFLDMNLLFRRLHDKSDDKNFSTYSTDNNLQQKNTIELDEIYIPNTKTDPTKEENIPNNKILKNNPRVFLCATLWREERHEMLQLLKSLFRLDKHCLASKCAEEIFQTHDPDKFQPEIHIMFDDAFTKHNTYNEFVEQLIELVGIAAKTIVGEINWGEIPYKSILPYGERLVWTLPGKTKMVVHLKDKMKIRHRKRWSQTMYMYYLLGYIFTGYTRECDFLSKSKLSKRRKADNREGIIVEDADQKHIFDTKGSPLQRLPNNKKADITNTFILTLDGDVDFQPEAVLLLLDRMKTNEKVGAVCGRIHPLGSGPLVWYQKYEYAIGQWLQKATEHVVGCVMCCPGCFSLFRASALMSDGVMKTHAAKPETAAEYIMCDQGEDRWLCQLLLQRGYKLDYCAAADAYTYAPETFNGLFVQRRRWAPSHIFSTIEFLSTWRSTVLVNANLNRVFMLYQLGMFVFSSLSPATVTLFIAGAYRNILGMSQTYSYMLAVTPVIIYVCVCLKCSKDFQLNFCALLTAIHSFVMVVVTVWIIAIIVNGELLTPLILFWIAIGVIFVVVGLVHPKEIECNFAGILFYLTIPTTFIFLPVYYLCNMNNVSWGTREGPKTTHNVTVKTGWQLFYEYMKTSFCEDVVTLIRRILQKSNENANAQSFNANHDKDVVIDRCEPKPEIKHDKIKDKNKYDFHISNEYEKENAFWTWLIKKYLEPIPKDIEHQKILSAKLLKLRDNALFAILLLNGLFSIVVLLLQINGDKLTGFYIMGKHEPVATIYLGFLLLMLIIQFTCMLFHRWSTFQHLISSTELPTMCRDNKSSLNNDEIFQNALRETTVLMNPGYDADDDFTPEYETEIEELTFSSSQSNQITGNELENELEKNLRKQRRRYKRYAEQAAQNNTVVVNKAQRTRTELYGRTIGRHEGRRSPYNQNDLYN